MKILGKNSLSAGVKIGLKVVLAIVIILEIALIAFSIITKANIIEEPKNYRRTKKHNIIFIHGNCNTSSNSCL